MILFSFKTYVFVTCFNTFWKQKVTPKLISEIVNFDAKLSWDFNNPWMLMEEQLDRVLLEGEGILLLLWLFPRCQTEPRIQVAIF